MEYLFEDLFRYAGLCMCLPLPLLALVVLAVVGLRQFARVQERIKALEAGQQRLREKLAGLEQNLTGAPTSQVVPLPIEAAQDIPVVQAAQGWPPPLPPRPGALPATPALSWETFIGGRALGWIAVLLLLFAAAFFLNYAIENEWIDELGRVVLGVAVGTGLCAGGFLMHRRGWRVFAQMLTAAGVVVLYLVTFAAFGYYQLMPRQSGAVFLILIIAETGLLALLYDAPAIAIMAVIGGLLTPPLLHSQRDQYVSLFLYLGILNASTVILGLARRWWVMLTLALVGTQILFGGWYELNYHPEKWAACMLFQGGLFTLYLVHPLILTGWRRLSPSVEDLGRWLLNAGFAAGMGYLLLEPDFRPWLSAMGLGLASLYTLLGWLLLGRSPDSRLSFTAVAIAMGFIAIVLPLEMEAGWAAIGWAVQGLCLAAFGVRIRSLSLRLLGASFLAVATGWVMIANLPSRPFESFIPLINRYALPVLAVSVCLLAAGWLGRRFRARLQIVDELGAWLGVIAGLGLLWLILTMDTSRYFTIRAEMAMGNLDFKGQPANLDLPPGLRDQQIREREQVFQERLDQADGLRRMGQAAVSVVWALFAAGLLGVGFALRSPALRWGALGLFALTLGKVMLVDMDGLPGLYRVAAFLMLAVVLGAAAWAYQRFSRTKAAA